MTSIYAWSKAPADNATADTGINWRENQAPSTVNNSSRQEMARVAEWIEDTAAARLSTGIANVYEVTIASQPGTYTAHLRMTFRAHQTNGGAAQINVNGMGLKPLRRRSAVALLSSEIEQGAAITAYYVQATDECLIQSGGGVPGGGGFTQPQIESIINSYLENNPTDVREDIRVHIMAESASTTAPPASPTDGQFYIVPAGATGVWAGQDGKVAKRATGVWTFLTPVAGWSAWVKDVDRVFVHDGTWTGSTASAINTVLPSAQVKMSRLGQVTNFGGGLARVWLDESNKLFAVGASPMNGYSAATDTPQRVAFNVTPAAITKVIASGTSVYILDVNGHVWSYGGNANGQLGHGDTTDRTIATRIVFFVTNGLTVADIYPSSFAFGANDYVVFRVTTGLLYSCGSNNRGQLGVGDTVNKSTPTLVPTLTGVASVGTGSNESPHTLAIKTDGTLWATGRNNTGQLGVGDIVDKNSFVQVPGFTNAAQALAADGEVASVSSGMSLVRKSDGTVWATGYNANGQLGLGDTVDRSAFLQITTLSGVTSIALSSDGGDTTAAALTSASNVLLWGRNTHGAIGDGTTANRLAPFQPVAGFQGKATRIVIGGADQSGSQSTGAIVLTNDNEIWCAGYSTNGNLGIGSTAAINSTFAKAVSLSGAISDVVAVGTALTWGLSVLYSDGRAGVCGDNSSGQLGLGVAASDAPNFYDVISLTPFGPIGATGAGGATGAVAAAGDGTSSLPGIAFASDTNTGFFRPANDEVALSTGGAERARVDGAGNLGIGVTAPTRRLSAAVDDASNNAVSQVARLTHTTSGVPALGIGAGIEFEVETGPSNNEVGAAIEAVTTDVTAASEDFDIVFRTMAAGAVAAERARITSTGQIAAQAGSVTAPALAQTLDLNTGIYWETADQLAFGTGGVRVLFADSTQRVHFPSIGTTASAANAFLDNANSNRLLRSTSSARYKHEVEPVRDEQWRRLMSLRPVTYASLAEADRDDWRWYGLIAEEVAEIDPKLVHHVQSDDGESVPDGVQYERLTVLLIAALQKQDARVAELEKRLRSGSPSPTQRLPGGWELKDLLNRAGADEASLPLPRVPMTAEMARAAISRAAEAKRTKLGAGQIRYELAMQAKNGNVEAGTILNKEAAMRGLPIAVLSDEIIAERKQAERATMDLILIEARGLASIEESTDIEGSVEMVLAMIEAVGA